VTTHQTDHPNWPPNLIYYVDNHPIISSENYSIIIANVWNG